MQNGQDRPRFGRIKKFIAMPRCRRWAGLRLAIANNTSHNQLWVIHRRPECRGQGIAKFPTFMDRAWHAWVQVARKATRPGETPDKGVQTSFVKGEIRVTITQ